MTSARRFRATFWTLVGLANVLRDERRYTEAESAYTESLAILEKVFGLDHYNVAAATVELAALYRTQGRSELAELLYRRALPIEERALGARHPRTARTTAMYAALLRSAGRHAEALEAEVRVQAVLEDLLH